MLEGPDKDGLRDLLRSLDDDDPNCKLLLLEETIVGKTDHRVSKTKKTREERIEGILEAAVDVNTLFHKQQITSEVLKNYLKKRNQYVRDSEKKDVLRLRCKILWNSYTASNNVEAPAEYSSPASHASSAHPSTSTAQSPHQGRRTPATEGTRTDRTTLTEASPRRGPSTPASGSRKSLSMTKYFRNRKYPNRSEYHRRKKYQWRPDCPDRRNYPY